MRAKYSSHYKPSYPADRRLTGEERKNITNQFLSEIGVPIFPGLPPLEDFRTARFRNSEDVAKRCVILNQLLYRLIFTDPLRATPGEVRQYFKRYNLWDKVSPAEKKYMDEYDPSNDQGLSWRYENVGVLIWSLGVYDWLELPVVTFDYAGHLVQDMPSVLDDPTKWIKESSLRDGEEILNEKDLIFRIRYAIHKTMENTSPSGDGYVLLQIPTVFQFDKFIPEVVSERCHALHWLTHPSVKWDDGFLDSFNS